MSLEIFLLKHKKAAVWLLAILSIVLISASLFFYFYNPAPRLEVDFLDVGQGDSILIKAPAGQRILIDGGPDKSVLRQLGRVLPFWERRIDLMILTHPHDDHVGGLLEVLKRYRVEKILYTGALHTSPNYLAWLKLVREKKAPLTIIDRPQTIDLGKNARLEIIWPRENLAGRTTKNLNNSSIVSRLVYGRSEFLLMGDAEIEVEAALIRSRAELSADALKVGHHGSDNATTEEFLRQTEPATAVIEVGADNKFGHPSRRVIKRLERAGVKLYRTDLNGTIKLVSDGEKIMAEVSK